MHEETQPRTAHAPLPFDRQQVFARAVVGSIVLCAAFGLPAAAQTASGDAQPADQGGAQLQRVRLSARRIGELLAGVRRQAKQTDFDSDKAIDITVEAEAVGNADDDPLHSYSVRCSPDTDEFWCEAAARLVQDLRGSAIHHLLKDANRVTVTLRPDGQTASAQMIARFDAEAKALYTANIQRVIIARAREVYRNIADAVLVLDGMTVSASGKQYALKLEMSREQAGNLLRKHLSLP